MGSFSSISSNLSFPELERKVLQIWAERNAFQRSITQRSIEKSYVFYDGPPFATGLPTMVTWLHQRSKTLCPATGP